MESLEATHEAHFSFSDSGSKRVDTTDATLLVKIYGVEPYLDGLKVHFGIANMYAVAFGGLQLGLVWDGGKKIEDVPQQLVPGTSTPVDVIISPASPDRTKGVKVMAVTHTITMRER